MGNNFLQFDSENANILTQEEYLNDTQRINGASSGIARSKLFNKAVRQSTTMAAAIGEIISERGGNATEDITALKAAILDKLLAASGIPLSAEATGLYGVNNVDAALRAIFASKFYGKYSQMSGGIEKSGSAQNGVITFTTEDFDDFQAINIAQSSSRIVIPVGITRAKFYINARIQSNQYSSGNDVMLSLRKNGVNIQTIAYAGNQAAADSTVIHETFYSMPVECAQGDYFEIYVTMSASSSSGSLTAGSRFGMEAIG